MIKQLSNPFQSPNNILKVTNQDGFCCGTYPLCRSAFRTTLAQLGQIGFTVKCRGKQEEYFVDISSATTVEELETLLREKVSTMIPEGGFGATISGSDCIEVAVDGTDIVVCLDGDLQLTGHTQVNGTVNEINKQCEKVTVFTNRGVAAVSTDLAIAYNGSTATITGQAAADVATFQTDIEAFLGAQGLTNVTVSVSVSDDGSVFVVDITSPAQSAEITFDGAVLEQCAVDCEWVGDKLTLAPFTKAKKPTKK